VPDLGPFTEGPGPTISPGSLPAPRVACRYSPAGFDRQHVESTLRSEEAPQQPYEKIPRCNQKLNTLRKRKQYFYSLGINRPINYSYRGIYNERFTYPSPLLHLFTPQQLYSSNIPRVYYNFLSNPPFTAHYALWIHLDATVLLVGDLRYPGLVS
jgi:hypothetical protein